MRHLVETHISLTRENSLDEIPSPRREDEIYGFDLRYRSYTLNEEIRSFLQFRIVSLSFAIALEATDPDPIDIVPCTVTGLSTWIAVDAPERANCHSFRFETELCEDTLKLPSRMVRRNVIFADIGMSLCEVRGFGRGEKFLSNVHETRSKYFIYRGGIYQFRRRDVVHSDDHSSAVKNVERNSSPSCEDPDDVCRRDIVRGTHADTVGGGDEPVDAPIFVRS